jgi:hypothetical protein
MAAGALWVGLALVLRTRAPRTLSGCRRRHGAALTASIKINAERISSWRRRSSLRR